MADTHKKTAAVTVILATHNGGERLHRTLSSMQGLMAPPGGWKLIIVDNASTDNTPAIIDGFAGTLPLTKLEHATPGKNGALNKALPLMEGRLTVFTDDDVIVPPAWLTDYLNLADSNPAFSVFGGRIVPDWPSPPPRAVLEGISIGDAYALHETDLPDGEINPGKIWGPNMAVRTALFEEGARFNDQIGPSGKNYIPGSESSFNIAMAAKGHSFFFSNTIVVQHQIRPEQLTPVWIKGRAYRLGRGKVHWAMQEGRLDPDTGRIPGWYYRLRFTSACRRVFFSMINNELGAMKALWQLNVARGMIDEFKAVKKRLYKSGSGQA